MAGAFVQGHDVYRGIFPPALSPGSIRLMIPGFVVCSLLGKTYGKFSQGHSSSIHVLTTPTHD